MYCHKNVSGSPIDLPVGKVVCVGRNYQDHIDELRNETPAQPLLFMKPASALCEMDAPIIIPTHLGECHNELEIAVLIAKPLKNAASDDVEQAVWGMGLGLDLTLRDIQNELKAKGHPWERAKAFDRSAPVSHFIPASEFSNWDDIAFSLSVNGEQRQVGNTRLMLHNLTSLISHASCVFSLAPGDVVLTGTPKGVAALSEGDSLSASLEEKLTVTTHVVAE